jgi:hypothetical protein
MEVMRSDRKYVASVAGIASIVFVFLASGVCSAWAQGSRARAGDENSTIVRWAAGKYMYRVSEDMRQRGFEEFRLSVHDDGSRTYTMWYSVFEDSLDTSVILRVDENFRPMSFYKTAWIGDTMTNTFGQVSGNMLEATVQINDEVVKTTLEVPDQFTLMCGPITADALHFGPYDKAIGGTQVSSMLASVSAGGESTPIGKATKTDPADIGLRMMQKIEFELVGQEKVETVAGVFETDHYRMEGWSDFWLTGPDMLLVKYQWHPNGYEYELIEYASGP